MSNQPTEITDADREAALAFRLYIHSLPEEDYRAKELRRKILNGEWDDKEAVQAFTRHRIAHATPAQRSIPAQETAFSPAGETVRERAAEAIARVLGIDIFERCPSEDSDGDIGCDSSSCPGALTEDHDTEEHLERIYRMADAALSAAGQ